MSTTVEKTVVVNVPLSTAYNQWTQFEEFPRFMGGVRSVTQVTDDRLEWVAEIGGVRRQWTAQILEQVPDRKVAWVATEGATNAGAVTFEDAGEGRTSVHLVLEYEPEGLVEKVGDTLHVVENQAEKDLERFKAFIEDQGRSTGAWRGTLTDGAGAGTPNREDTAASGAGDQHAGTAARGAAATRDGADDNSEPDPPTWPPLETEGTARTADDDDLPNHPLDKDGSPETGSTTGPGFPTQPPTTPGGTIGAGMGTTPAEAPTAYDQAPTAHPPVPPVGSIEDRIAPTGAPRLDVDGDLPEHPLGVDTPLDEEAATPRGQTPMVAPDVAPVDITPPEARPGTGQGDTPTQPPTADDMVSPPRTTGDTGVDAPLDEEPVPPLGEVPPIAPPDVVPAEDSRVGTAPGTDHPEEGDRPTGGKV